MKYMLTVKEEKVATIAEDGIVTIYSNNHYLTIEPGRALSLGDWLYDYRCLLAEKANIVQIEKKTSIRIE